MLRTVIVETLHCSIHCYEQGSDLVMKLTRTFEDKEHFMSTCSAGDFFPCGGSYIQFLEGKKDTPFMQHSGNVGVSDQFLWVCYTCAAATHNRLQEG